MFDLTAKLFHLAQAGGLNYREYYKCEKIGSGKFEN